MYFSRSITPLVRRTLNCQRRGFASIFEVKSEEDFSSKVLQSNEPVAVQFYADWCGPCKSLAPRLENKITDRQDISLAKVNIDDLGALAIDYGVSSVPTVKLFKDGEVLSSFTGNINDEQLDEFIDAATKQ